MSAAVEEERKEEECPQAPPSSSCPTSAERTLTTLTFDNSALRSLPVGRDGERGTLFSYVEPTPLLNPKVVSLSPAALRLIDLSTDRLLADPNTPLYLAGNLPIPGSQYAAHCYCGHQFGVFAGQLGDGAVCYIGEVINARGERWEIQFKGSGLTPYSRSADGRKVLRSSLREYLASEAMDALGVPTTRAASLVTSETMILRDQFYTGDVRRERASIITRLAPSFIRFGSFEVCKTRDPRTGASGPCVGRLDVLHQLFDYVHSTFFPHITQPKPHAIAALFSDVLQSTAHLIAAWQSVGFIHGVMNTDNMSVLGLTLDYGPYQFMDYYIPSSTSNTSDDNFRYAYNQQKIVGRWNLRKFSEALSLLWGEGGSEEGMRVMTGILESDYDRVFDEEYHRRMCEKLGLRKEAAHAERAKELELIELFLSTMEATCSDFTNSFRILSSLSLHGPDNSGELVQYLTQQAAPLATYLPSLASRIDPEQLLYYQAILASHPHVQDSSGMIAGELARRDRRAKAPRTDSEKADRDRALWSRFIGDYRAYSQRVWGQGEDALRRRAMNAVNPKYVLRNWMAQVAIEKAEAGDAGEVNALLDVLREPFAVDEDERLLREGEGKAKELGESKGGARYTCRPPEGYENVLCSCSS